MNYYQYMTLLNNCHFYYAQKESIFDFKLLKYSKLSASDFIALKLLFFFA